MNRSRQQPWLGRCAWVLVVVFAIALVMVLSAAIAVSAGHGLDHISLALPVFFVFNFLVISFGDWFSPGQFFFEPKAELSPAQPRGPPRLIFL